jgi:prepilin-type N-terminal cleavage/methylation domain-containing protein
LARHSSRANAGFSLVEVLAALVVTALLVLALTPLTGQMVATWSRGTEASRAVELKTRGIGLLRDDLRHALSWSGFGRMEDLILFRGTETSLSFPMVSGLGPGRSGVEMVLISVDTSRDGLALVRRHAPLIGSTYGAFSDPVVLFSGPFKYIFRYDTQENRTLPIWANRPELPARVELVILDGRGPIFSAPIELPVFASLSAGCLLNTTLQGCPALPQPEEENEWEKSMKGESSSQ